MSRNQGILPLKVHPIHDAGKHSNVDKKQLYRTKVPIFTSSPVKPTLRQYITSMSHGSSGIVQKIDRKPDLGCTTIKKLRKVVLDNPSVCVCVCVCLSVSVCLSDCLSDCLSVCLCLSACLAVAFLAALTGVSVNRSSWNFRGMLSYMGHCVVSIFDWLIFICPFYLNLVLVSSF